MFHKLLRCILVLLLALTALAGGSGIANAYLCPVNTAVNDPLNPDYAPPVSILTPGSPECDAYTIGPGNQYPDYLTTPNWAYSPPMRKFVDPLPGLCVPSAANNMCENGNSQANTADKNIPLALPDIVTYPGSDYYEIELVEFSEKQHSDLPPTRMRGYRQVGFATDYETSGCSDPILGQPDACTAANNTLDFSNSTAHYLGPIIVSIKDRPVRVKFINRLPSGEGGELFVPVDQSVMGSGDFDIDYDPVTKAAKTRTQGVFSQNRGELHLHGGRSPWISDGTPHQWIVPKEETDPGGRMENYQKGVSVVNVPDMPDPGPGAQTYYWTNQQSARLMFYHDHAWGITRLNVYVGEAAGYIIQDQTETDMVNEGILPMDEIPLVIQDKTYVDGDPASPTYVLKTDPTWRWGTGAKIGTVTEFGQLAPVHQPNTGDLWWPHVYMPAQNPFDTTGIAPMGRWAYGPYFWPATQNHFQPIANPYFNPLCDVTDPLQNETNTAGYTVVNGVPYCQPPEAPSTPNPSWGAEAFMDTPTVNGTAYPVLNVEPKAYRLRILNAAHDRFFNLSMFKADSSVDANVTRSDDPATPNDEAALTAASSAACNNFQGGCASLTEVRMLPADPNPNMPATWPADGREGGIPDWNMAGPKWIQVANEGGFLPQPVVIPPNPVNWNADVTTFNAGNVSGGSLILGPAERADVIVDFSAYAGQTLIVYNDAPAPWPALDPHYDYFTGAPDMTDAGGAVTTLPGLGPNIRTVMKIVVGGTQSTAEANTSTVNPSGNFSLPLLEAAFAGTLTNSVFNNKDGVFRQGQDALIVGQGTLNPTSDPAKFEAFMFDGVGEFTDPAYANGYDFSSYDTIYDTTFPTTFPEWGLAQINDKNLKFKTINPDGTLNPVIQDVVMKTKAIQDEQGETFDDYGRMRAGLGLQMINPGANQVKFVIQTYSDPATEVIEEGGLQVWKITHNGVDTHPVHFHLYDVQVINRVGWDGFLRLPDPNEMGWKDTIRISPLEDTIVALRPVTPLVPFGVPQSIRPLNPARPVTTGDITELTPLDPFTGEARNPPLSNMMYDLDWEYVWHCHILSHEENDMMRPQSFQYVEWKPVPPTAVTAVGNGAQIDLSWTDPTPGDDPASFGDKTGEIGFRVYRSDDNGATFTPLTDSFGNPVEPLANQTSVVDTTAQMGLDYQYQVTSFNAYNAAVLPGPPYEIIPTFESVASNIASVTMPKVALTAPADGDTFVAPVDLNLDTATSGDIQSVTFMDNGLPLDTVASPNPFTYNWTNVPAGDHTLTAIAFDGTTNSFSTPITISVIGATQAPANLNVPVTGTGVGSNTISWDATTTPGASVTYRLEQSTDNFATSTLIYSGPNTSKAVTVYNNGNYSYRVNATVTGFGTSDWRYGNNDWVVTIPVAAPVLSVPTSSSISSYTLSWTASPTVGATYVLQESTTTNFSASPDIPLTGLSYTAIGKTNGTYYYRLKAVNPPMADSAWSPTKSINVAFPTTAPASITVPVRSTTGSYTVSWSATTTPGTTTYTLQESTSADFTTGVTTIATGLTGLSHTVTPAKTDGTFYYRVNATTATYATSQWRSGANGVAIIRTTITSPTGGTFDLGTPIDLTATATTPAGYTVDTIEYYDNGTLVGFTSTGPSYSFSYTPAATGAHSLTALTYYTNGASSLSPAVPFNVAGPLVPPVITSPLSGAVYPFGAPINLSIEPPAAIAGAAINLVAYYDGVAPLAFATLPPYSATWTPTTSGAKTLTAVVYYSNGTTTTSVEVPITVSVGITTSALPNGSVGATYNQTLIGGGGTAPLTWSAYGLPGGLSLNASTGAITGTPAAGNIRAGSTYADFPVSIFLKDDTGFSDGKVLFMRIYQ